MKKSFRLAVSLIEVSLLIFGFFALARYHANVVTVQDMASAASVVDGAFYYETKVRDIPFLESMNYEAYESYLAYANKKIYERYSFYRFHYGKDLRIDYAVAQPGLFTYRLTLTGSGTDQNGVSHEIADTIVIKYGDIYWGKEATVQITPQQLGA